MCSYFFEEHYHGNQENSANTKVENLITNKVNQYINNVKYCLLCETQKKPISHTSQERKEKSSYNSKLKMYINFEKIKQTIARNNQVRCS